MSNLTILEQNTLLGFEHDDTQLLYLRGSQINELKAFKMACEWQDYLRQIMEFMRKYYNNDKTCNEVIDFIKERHYRRWFPGN
jgi:hypothetical protein